MRIIAGVTTTYPVTCGASAWTRADPHVTVPTNAVTQGGTREDVLICDLSSPCYSQLDTAS